MKGLNNLSRKLISSQLHCRVKWRRRWVIGSDPESQLWIPQPGIPKLVFLLVYFLAFSSRFFYAIFNSAHVALSHYFLHDNNLNLTLWATCLSSAVWVLEIRRSNRRTRILQFPSGIILETQQSIDQIFSCNGLRCTHSLQVVFALCI